MTGKALGAGLNEAIYHGAQSPLSKFIPEAVKPLNVVKPKGGGGNWLNVESHLESIKPNAGIDPKDAYELGISNRGDVAISNWIDTKLNRYIKNEMGTPDDPVRKLAEKGKLHIEPDVGNNLRVRAQQHRLGQNYPTEGSAGSQLAADWEALTDAQIQSRKAKDVRIQSADEPFLKDLSPEDTVHSFGTSFNPNKILGFDHIIDELRNATTLGDNLPKVLQIDPAKLERMSMADVVNHVSKINEWRANQAARSHDAAIKTLEKSPVTSVVKEYPDGYKWVELKLPDTVQDITSLIRKDGDVFEIYEPGQSLSWKDPSTGKIGWKSPEDATAAYSKSKNYGELEKALELEGSSMGHCVGGYCPAVAEGKVRIFSLRDPKGRAHATIEVEPPVSPREGTIGQEELPPDVFADLKRRNVLDDNIRWKFDDTTGRYMPQLGPFEPTIHQIKGKGNARPIEKYDPYTQDFIQGNDWHIVEEAHNAGLRDTSYELGTTLKYAEEGLGLKLPRFVSDKDYRQLIQHMDETIDTGIPREVPDALKKYLPVEAAPAPAPLPALTPEPVTNPFWYNPKSKQLEVFDLENTHTKSLMDPDYAAKLGVSPLDPSSLNLEHGSLLMGRTEKTAPNTLNLMQVDELTPESLASIKNMLGEKNIPHEKISLSGGSSLYENVPTEAIRSATSLDDLKPYRIGDEEVISEIAPPPVKEQKMLQGFYRGYAGDYDTDKAAQEAGMVFVSPQRGVGDIFANKRAEQMGADPHLEMVLADPFAGYGYGMNVPINKTNQKIDFTKARQLSPEDVVSKTQLYAAGGAVMPPSDFTSPDMGDGDKFFTDPDFARFVMEQPR
jgi:hypothetical protein